VAFDIGPANALIDAALEWTSGGAAHFDEGGRLAAAGTLEGPLFDRLIEDPYFSLQPPKSTGKELFNLGYLISRLDDRQLSTEDLVATVTAASAEITAAGLRPFDLTRLYAAGGGTRNPSFMAELAARLPGVAIHPFDELGVPEQAKESLLFAVIGFLTLAGLPGNVPSATGASRPVVLGSITPGTRPLAAAAGGDPPQRLVMRRPSPR